MTEELLNQVSEALHWCLQLAAGHVQMGNPGYEQACATLEAIKAAIGETQ